MYFTNKIRVLFTLLLVIFFGFYILPASSSDDLISLFPLDKYDQKITDWVSVSNPNYTKALLSPTQQARHKAELYRHYFGNESPWNESYVNLLFSQPAPHDLRLLEEEKINSFTNQNKLEKIGYGVNFRPHSEQWLIQIKNNAQLKQFIAQHYDPTKRAIAITNIQGRVLPTNDPHFYSYKLAGEGYPFDNVQASVIWAGTPLYILGETVDHAWSMVLSPSFIAWVRNNDIAKVNNHFVAQWLKAAQQNLAAITNTQISILDTENKLFRFSGFIGMLFPAIKQLKNIEILIPVADEKRQAHIHHAQPLMQDLALIPLLPTPQHFSNIMQHLLGRTYGWGGQYFYNDCSGELKNLYTTFGIWLPMHSTDQADPQKVLAKLVDLSLSEPTARKAYLMDHGHPWMTVIHVGGHVLDYLGNYPDPMDPAHPIVPLSYQNAWGLGAVAGQPPRRSVIGQSVLFPLLLSYPEDGMLLSQLKKPTFQLLYLDEPPAEDIKRSQFPDIHSLLSP